MVCLFDFTVVDLQSHWTTPGVDRAKPMVKWFLCGKRPKMSQSRAPAVDCSGPRPWAALVLRSVPRDPIPTTPPSPHSISRYRYHSVSHCVSHEPQVPEKNQKNSWKQLKTSHQLPECWFFFLTWGSRDRGATKASHRCLLTVLPGVWAGGQAVGAVGKERRC